MHLILTLVVSYTIKTLHSFSPIDQLGVDHHSEKAGLYLPVLTILAVDALFSSPTSLIALPGDSCNLQCFGLWKFLYTVF